MSPRTLRAAIGVSSILLTLVTSAWAEPVKLDLKMGPIEQSRAYQLFKTRTPNELSKLIFLIDRFKDAKIKFVYEGIEYPPSFVARLARWFLSTHYHGEKSTKWIMLWCNKSFSSRQLISVSYTHLSLPKMPMSTALLSFWLLRQWPKSKRRHE